MRLHRHDEQERLSARRDRQPPLLAGQDRHDRPRGAKRDRDQLLAEALQLFRDGVQWWPDRPFEAKHIKPEQESGYEEDAVGGPIASTILDGLDDPKVTISQVAKCALGVPVRRQDWNRRCAAHRPLFLSG